MNPFILNVTLAMNLIFSSWCFLFLRNLNMNQLEVSFLNKNIFQWNNGCFVFFRCGYSITNHVICSPFVPIKIIFGRRLLNYSFMKTMLTVVVYGTLSLIIQGIALSMRFPIMIWYFSLKRFVFGIIIFWQMGDT